MLDILLIYALYEEYIFIKFIESYAQKLVNKT